MEKKADVKKIVCLVVCVALIVIACIVGVDFNKITVKSGKGRNAKITSLEDMSIMLSDFGEPLSDFSYSKNSAARNASKTDDAVSAKYKSVTIHEQSSCYTYAKNGRGFSKVIIQRSMDIGITESATYYHSMFTLSADSRTEAYYSNDGMVQETDYGSNADIDLEIYISEDRFLLRFNRFSMATDGKNIMGIERVLGQWGDFSDDTDVGQAVISSLGSTNSKNFRIFGLMGKYIADSDDDIFSKRGDVYTLKKDASGGFASSLLGIAGGSGLAEDFDCEFEVDLGSAASPVVTLLLDSDQSYDKTGSMRVYEKDVFEFTNINNTVIDIPSSLSALSAEEFDAYMSELEEDD
ncbi:MAG: hypothetical protein NC184_06240 [Roseburia sp.]|nr:hypothetical protein [Roseburia sp.]